MGKAWIRQEIKKDKFADSVERTVRLAHLNPQTAAGLAFGGLLAVFVTVYFVTRFYEVRTKAWEELAAAQRLASSDASKIVPALDAIRSRFPSAAASDQSSFPARSAPSRRARKISGL